MRRYIAFLFVVMCGHTAIADSECPAGYTLSQFNESSTVPTRGGGCYAGYEVVTISNFRLIPSGSGYACPNGQHRESGNCVADVVGNCDTGFHDSGINTGGTFVQSLGGTCYAGYQTQHTNRNVSYLIANTSTPCGSGYYPTTSGCTQNPRTGCPTGYFAPVPTSAFARQSNGTCATNYSVSDIDTEFCKLFLGTDMADFCTPQRTCTGGARTINSNNPQIQLPIYDDMATHPSVGIRFSNGKECFMNLLDGSAQGGINIEYDDNIYHGVN